MSASSPFVLLSFDAEEFDLSRENGVKLSLEEAVRVSEQGVSVILDMLKENDVQATFFCTSNFATHAHDAVCRMLSDGHEVASHGCDHWRPAIGDAALSKNILEKFTGTSILGYRQPRMAAVSTQELAAQGYLYDSSLHPTFIPGRYMHLGAPRVPFIKDGLVELPMSVTTWLRLPLFWLACHHYPFSLYRWLCLRTLRHDGHLVLYFHPWEFVPLAKHPEWKIPMLIRRRSGTSMQERLFSLITALKREGATFCTYRKFAEKVKNEKAEKAKK